MFEEVVLLITKEEWQRLLKHVKLNKELERR